MGVYSSKNRDLHHNLVIVNSQKILERHKDLLYGDKFIENRELK